MATMKDIATEMALHPEAFSWPVVVGGSLVWACCVSYVGPPCEHNAPLDNEHRDMVN